ncbi:MAG: HAD hydrolase family protein [Myxococcales bacterium]|nr:HAD hydrolase family protein [Myxococcales bacterium]
MTWSERAARIRAIVLDVDGVLTDGGVFYGPDGATFKRFEVRDGQAIRMARASGLAVGLISGRSDPGTLRRAEELDLDFVRTGEQDKLEGLRRILEEQGLQAAECLYVGDDLPDLPAMREAGIGVAVGDALPEVRERADLVLETTGGHGAVREVIVRLMQAQGTWKAAAGRYFDAE